MFRGTTCIRGQPPAHSFPGNGGLRKALRYTRSGLLLGSDLHPSRPRTSTSRPLSAGAKEGYSSPSMHFTYLLVYHFFARLASIIFANYLKTRCINRTLYASVISSTLTPREDNFATVTFIK